MRILLVDAYPADSPDRVVATTAESVLSEGGHDVTHRVLSGGPFEAFMSSAEREAYHTDEPLITPETIEDAALVKGAEALLFCYPTVLFNTPALLKNWLERVFVPGVAFVFDDQDRVSPGLGNLRRLGTITTTVQDANATKRARDNGRRTTQRTIRMSCHRFCRRTFLSLDAGAPDIAQIKRKLERW